MLKNVSDNINNIPIPDELKYLNALQLLEDEEYTYNGEVKSCYRCDASALEYHFIKQNEINDFLQFKTSLSYSEATFLSNFINLELQKQNKIKELVKGNHIMIIVCKKCNTVLQIGNFIMFDGLPISQMAFEQWNLIRIYGNEGSLIDLKGTFSWKICPDCGGIVYSVLGIDNNEEKQCRECKKTFEYYEKLEKLTKYL